MPFNSKEREQVRRPAGLCGVLAELVQQTTDSGPKTRRAITRMGEGVLHSIGSHDYQLLFTELACKKMKPMLATLHARELKEIVSTGDRKNGLSSHEGEEVLFVVSGEVVLHTEFYSPVLLNQGDCAYDRQLNGARMPERFGRGCGDFLGLHRA